MKGFYGKCPWVLCEWSPLIPYSTSDTPNVAKLSVVCIWCNREYVSKDDWLTKTDGAFYGASFASIFKASFGTKQSKQQYVPKVYGFKVSIQSEIFPKLKFEKKKENEEIQMQLNV